MKYTPLHADESAVEEGTATVGTVHRVSRQSALVHLLGFALLISLALNGIACSRLLLVSPSPADQTRIAGLTWNTPSIIQYNSPFNHPSRSIEDAAWSSSLVDPATLVVALDDSFTESQNVMHSMRWPWDQSKGVYTLNSAHELHCLHLLRKTIIQAYDGEDLSWPRGHSAHCLEYLLQNVMCYADDSLLYQGRLHENKHAAVPIGGLGDTKMCRSWSRLQEWASEHSACYNPYVGEDDPNFPEVDKYKYCPGGEKPWQDM